MALMTLATKEPRDVLMLAAASASNSESPPIESVTIETANEPTTESLDTTSEMVPTDVEISPTGELALNPETSLQAADQTSPSARDSLAEAFQDAQATALSKALPEAKSDAKSTIFCGVNSGGNRLCFIVDNSSSMSRGRFEAARSELLRTIDTLGADKRFYVIFYNQKMNPMCLESNTPTEQLTFASDDSKRSLRNWAMTIGLDRGAPPDEALRWAFQLEPEVIFMLTDGEFPDHTEKLLQELNHQENLFGSKTRRCLVHTIAFHSEAGVERLRRIASTHGGTFRFIPPP